MAGLSIAILLGIASAAPAVAEEDPLRVVCTQVPAACPVGGAPFASEPFPPTSGAADGSRIVLIEPPAEPVILTPDFAAAADPDVSFDGRRLLFAGKKRPEDNWNIWELELETRQLRQVTHAKRDCRNPLWLSSLYVLSSTKPWYTILFVGSEPSLDERGTGPSTSLYTVRLDGSEMRRITFSPGRDRAPWLLPDGRVLFSSDRFVAGVPGERQRTALFDVGFDGTDLMLYGATQGRRVQHMACSATDDLVVFVEGDELQRDGAGALGSLRRRRPHHSYRPLSDDGDVLWHSPAPVGDGTLLVSRRAATGGGTHGLWHLRPADGVSAPVFDAPDYHEVGARVVRSRPEPDGRSTVVDPAHETGKLFCLNVYDADAALRSAMRPGSVDRIRLIEGVPAESAGASAASDGRSTVARRVLGEAPVHEDGSFHLEIVPDIPMEIQALDHDGVAIATCRWVWVMRRERRGCIGCHEDPELTPENTYVDAVVAKATRLTPPPAERRTVSFVGDVMPILAARCATAGCHGGDDTPLRMTSSAHGRGAEASTYRTLLAPRDKGPPYVVAGSARDSYLVWRALGKQSPHAAHAAAKEIKPMPPSGKAPPLDEKERRTIIEWIDLGAPFSSSSAAPAKPDRKTADSKRGNAP